MAPLWGGIISKGGSMGFEEPRARAASLAPRVPPGVGEGRARANAPRVDAEDATDAAQGLREACHDMRQPVAGVLALAGAALAEPGLPGAVRGDLEQIIQYAEWLADMIQDRLQSARSGEPGTRTGLAVDPR